MQAQQAATPNADDGVLGDYLTREQLADQLHVTVRTLARWKWSRQGPASVKVGGRVLYRKDVVAKWLESLTERSE